jgi:hypothetical protein
MLIVIVIAKKTPFSLKTKMSLQPLRESSMFLRSIVMLSTNDKSWDSSVNVVSDYGLDDRVIEVRSPAKVRVFFL